MRRCRGYIIDNICPLVCCGLDAPQNMQWQNRGGGQGKDSWERDCSTCRPGSPMGRDGRKPQQAGESPEGRGVSQGARLASVRALRLGLSSPTFRT